MAPISACLVPRSAGHDRLDCSTESSSRIHAMRKSDVRPAGLLLLFVALFGLVAPASAHHSFAMFQKDKVIAIEGIVRRFGWTNPHVFIALDVTGKQGEIVQYKVESASINMLMRQGWKPNAIKVGDRIKVTLNPLKNGQHGGLLIEATLPSGAVLKG